MSTALMLASLGDNIDMIKALIDAGAYINAKNNNGDTALMWASFGGHIATVKLLLEKGANPNFITIDGNTALTYNSKAADNQSNYNNIKKLLKSMVLKSKYTQSYNTVIDGRRFLSNY
jgi:ankyrin repeat protein